MNVYLCRKEVHFKLQCICVGVAITQKSLYKLKCGSYFIISKGNVLKDFGMDHTLLECNQKNESTGKVM